MYIITTPNQISHFEARDLAIKISVSLTSKGLEHKIEYAQGPDDYIELIPKAKNRFAYKADPESLFYSKGELMQKHVDAHFTDMCLRACPESKDYDFEFTYTLTSGPYSTNSTLYLVYAEEDDALTPIPSQIETHFTDYMLCNHAIACHYVAYRLQNEA